MELDHVTIAVSDIKKSTDFYSRLGLELIVKADHYCRFIVPGNEATFSIHISKEVQPGSTIFYFQISQLDEAVTSLKEKGFVFDQEPTDQPWLWREAYLKDPDGHLLCLYAAGENKLNPPWRIKA
jgi:catechol 2,3-dioxygenase-like lactoylglutathione lyase family enzyme